MHPANHSPGAFSRALPDEAATLAFGAELARALRAGLVIALRGDLGAGKTTLVRGVLRALGYAGRVRSPTFTLVELYAISNLKLHHFDFYRFEDPRELGDAGFREYFGHGTICFIEWPERAAGMLPPVDVELMLSTMGEGRMLQASAITEAGRKCLAGLGANHA